MMKKYLNIPLILMIITVLSCDQIFEYSPYVINFEEDEQNLTQKNINELLSKNSKDILTTVLTADNQHFYDQSKRLVNTLNQKYNIDFLIHTGDFTDYCIPKQYEWSNKIFSQLTAPYFVVIVNHDLVSNGELSYKEMFGAFNFSFIYHSLKFVFINTNSREYAFDGTVPDLEWLQKKIKSDEEFDKAILVFHSPPFNADLESNFEVDFMNILLNSGNILFTTQRYLHSFNFSEPNTDGIPYLNTTSFENNEFVQVKTYTNEIIKLKDIADELSISTHQSQFDNQHIYFYTNNFYKKEV